MPLPPSVAREEVHHRRIDMRAFRRHDGLFDVEAHLVDTKPFEFQRLLGEPWPAGTPLHDMWLRLVVAADGTVHDIVAATDATPFAICGEATTALAVLVGERIGPGWSKVVRERLRGNASCTHLAELMLPLATTALQGIRGTQGLGQRQEAPRPGQIDSCYAFDGGREVVAMVWPQHVRKP